MADKQLGSSVDPARDRRALAVWLLAIAVVLTCAGMSAATYRGDGTSINSFLFLELGLSDAAASQIERLTMGAVLMASLGVLIWSHWALLVPVAAYFLAESLAGWHQGGYPFSQWTPLARAPTYLAPLALALLVHARKGTGHTAVLQQTSAVWALRLGIASLFVIHGLEAFYLNPRFIDLILSSSLNLTGVRLSESGAVTLLKVIGVLDIAIALAVLIKPWRVLLAWMAFWAALAAASRMTAHGWGAYPDFLLRATYFLTPVAVWSLTAALPKRRTTKTERTVSYPSEPASDLVS